MATDDAEDPSSLKLRRDKSAFVETSTSAAGYGGQVGATSPVILHPSYLVFSIQQFEDAFIPVLRP